MRFDQLRFVEDSAELYGLVAGIVRSRRSGTVHGPKTLAAAADTALHAGWFDGLEGTVNGPSWERPNWPLSDTDAPLTTIVYTVSVGLVVTTGAVRALRSSRSESWLMVTPLASRKVTVSASWVAARA